MTASPTHARGGQAQVHRGTPPPAERAHLRDTVGALLAHERMRRGWTQRRLSAAAGVAPQTVERIETGARRPSAGMLHRLARALRDDWAGEAVVALAERLIEAGGASVVDYSRRPHRRRKRLAAQVRAGGMSPAARADDLAGVAFLELLRRGPW